MLVLFDPFITNILKSSSMSVTREELERLTERVAVLEEEQSTIFKKIHSIFFDGEHDQQTPVNHNTVTNPQLQQVNSPAKSSKQVPMTYAQDAAALRVDISATKCCTLS
jgi:hypothetical protein